MHVIWRYGGKNGTELKVLEVAACKKWETGKAHGT